MIELFLGPLVMASTIRLMVPILFSAIGGSFGHKAGILNLGLDCFMAFSAFFSMLGSYITGSPWVGLLFGLITGIVLSFIFGLFVIYFRSNQVVVGIALNLASWGGTTFLLSSIFHTRGVFIDSRIISFKSVNIPIISQIPYIKEVIGNQNILVFLVIILLIISQWAMFNTPFGLRLRGVGIKPQASQTVGVNVVRYKWYATVICGAFCGLGGAFLSIGGASLFSENMTAGKGFLALAAIMVGDGNPILVFLACFVFGYTSALSVTLQSMGIPSQIVISIPYIVTVIILFINSLSGKYRYLFRKNEKIPREGIV